MGSSIFAGNADLILDRNQFATGPTCRANARRVHATGSLFPRGKLRGDPAASTWERRQFKFGANFSSVVGFNDISDPHENIGLSV